MRLLLAVVGSCCVFAAPCVRGEETFPYRAYITADDVYVRSGPGQSYYPTDKLKAGTEVEVYRHDPGGWYAIRPPKGSFSWVAARYLQWDSGPPKIPGIATVNTDRVAARVGSRFSDIRDVIQVRLHELEPVEVLEQERAAQGSEQTTWYKIAPPSGEFRWVFGKYVDPDYPHDGLRRPKAAESPIAPRADSAPDAPAAPASPSPAATRPRRDSSDSDGEPSAVADRRPSDPPGAADLPWRSADGEPGAGGSRVARVVSPEQFRAEIEALDMALSVMVVEEPTVWTFDRLRQRTESLLVQAETAVERGQARRLLGKIARFEDIKGRYDRVNLVRRRIERANRWLDELSPADRLTDLRREHEDRFDEVGELIRVVSPKLGAPRYALMDDGGQLRCYVSPAPGVNLRYYVGRLVGITGTRGYMPEQRSHHLTAQHVSAVEDRRLR